MDKKIDVIKTPTRVVGLAPIAPSVAAGSVDTPEFRNFLAWRCRDSSEEFAQRIIGHIDAWGAQQREAGKLAEMQSTVIMVQAYAERAEKAEARVVELEALRDAAGKLIKAKGRHHTEQNYLALVGAYDSVIKGNAARSAP